MPLPVHFRDHAFDCGRFTMPGNGGGDPRRWQDHGGATFAVAGVPATAV